MSQIKYFSEPDKVGWEYPASIIQIEKVILSLPSSDTDGIYAIGLVQSTRKQSSVDGRYFHTPQPTIHIYSYRSDYRFKLASNTKMKHVLNYLNVEIKYGMRLQQEGSRLVCCWDPLDLELFVLKHVLLHEVGHHVFYQNRSGNHLTKYPGRTVSEQFAEAYAVKMGATIFNS